jgi:cob(I)alamin adenosyltransferase
MNPRTLIFTGNGKGKTTAAFGMVMRAAGHDQRILVVQFLKSNAASGELQACSHLPRVEVVQMGCGFVVPPEHPDFATHCQKAREAMAYSCAAVAAGRHDLIVLDEICGAIAHEMISEDAVIEMLDTPGRAACIVLTGRHASTRLIEHADTVTEMHCIRHGYTAEILAQKGVEY